MRTIGSSLVLLGMMMTNVAAQDTPSAGAAESPAATAQPSVQPPATPLKRITVTVGLDVLTAYIFRGIHQESAGIVAQPPLDVGIVIGKGISANFGSWYSLHSGPSGNFYEADSYGSLTFTAGRLKPGVLFTSYTSPNDRFRTVHEIAAVVGIDDSASPFPLAPKATVAFELSGQADGGTGKGTYAELGIRPAVPLIKTKHPVTLSVPVRVGLSLKGYYEDPNGSDTFGFASSGLVASVPLTLKGVTWDFHGGVDFMWLGDNMALLNSGDRFKPMGIIGLTLTY